VIATKLSREDAKLIASAPELLEALRKIEASLLLSGEPELASQCYQLEVARIAIAKAEGRA
jgi:hypothetical protein